MNARATSLFLALFLAPGCSGPQGDYVLDNDEDAAAEAEANLAALRELVERNRQRQTERPEPPVEGLDVVVLTPERPPALDEDGALLRSALDAFLERGPHAVLGATTLEPARDDGGSPIGFRIEALHPGSEFITGAGLAIGDVVSTVNGHSILMPDGFIDAWNSLEDATALTLEVVRNGETATLAWDIADDTASP